MSETYDFEPPRRASASRWLWLIPVGCFGVLCCLVAFTFGIVAIVFAAMRSTWAYQEGLKLAKADAEVVRELGEPIEPGWFVSGSSRTNGAAGRAELAIPVTGPKSAGTLYVVANKRQGQWSFEEVDVVVDGRPEPIDLLEEPEPPVDP